MDNSSTINLLFNVVIPILVFIRIPFMLSDRFPRLVNTKLINTNGKNNFK